MTRLSAGLVAALVAVQPPAFRTRTDLVALPLTVVDAEGRPVQGLGKDAFSLTEDDRPQPIVQFTGDPVPLSLAIALDASTSMKGRRFEYARDAVWRLLDHLAPEDEVCLYGFNDRPFVISPWTSDVHAVERSLVKVSPDGTTALYATVSSALGALATSHHRRQAMVVISDGNDRDSSDNPMYRGPASTSPLDVAPGPEPTVSVDAASDSAARYAFDTAKRSSMRSASMCQIATATTRWTVPRSGSDRSHWRLHRNRSRRCRRGDGGRADCGRAPTPVPLGFVPAHADDGRFHRVRVTVTCPCQIRARAGFIADKRKSP
jgi:hypothetical protein